MYCMYSYITAHFVNKIRTFQTYKTESFIKTLSILLKNIHDSRETEKCAAESTRSPFSVNERQLMPSSSLHARWYAVYHEGVVSILMPLACALAILNNGLVILVAAGSSTFKHSTLLAVRLLIVSLAITDVCIVFFSRGPIVFGIFISTTF